MNAKFEAMLTTFTSPRSRKWRPRHAHAQERPPWVDPDDPVPLLGARLGEGYRVDHAGVVHEDIEAAQLLEHPPHEPLYPRFVRHVGQDGKRAPAEGLHLLGHPSWSPGQNRR